MSRRSKLMTKTMPKNWTRNLVQLAATAAAALVLGAFAPVNARAQAQSSSKYANATITVATTPNGDDSLHFSGDRCSLSLSGVGIVVDIDGTCWGWNRDADVPRGLWLRIARDKISYRQDDKNYAITDPSTVKRVRDAVAPLVDIFEREGALGEQERALGEKERQLGEQQRDVKVHVPDMSADFEKVEAEAKRLSAEGGTQSDIGDLQSELGDLQSRLGDLQSQAGDEQSKLGDQQSALGGQQSTLGEQQSALGDQAKEIAPGIAGKVRDILNQSIQNGTAKLK
jgi:hypothetical protein